MILEDERKLSEQYPDWQRARKWRGTHHVDLYPAGYRQALNTVPDSLAIIRRLRKESEIILSPPQFLRFPRWPLNYQMLGDKHGRTLSELIESYGSAPLTSIPTLNKGVAFRRI